MPAVLFKQSALSLNNSGALHHDGWLSDGEWQTIAPPSLRKTITGKFWKSVLTITLFWKVVRWWLLEEDEFSTNDVQLDWTSWGIIKPCVMGLCWCVIVSSVNVCLHERGRCVPPGYDHGDAGNRILHSHMPALISHIILHTSNHLIHTQWNHGITRKRDSLMRNKMEGDRRTAALARDLILPPWHDT